MKIKKLTVENFRQYKSVKIEIPKEKSEFVVILGTNGFGKSNLLNAISWCLYGLESKASGKAGQTLVNWESLEEAQDNELIRVTVELLIELAEGTDVVVRRDQRFARVSGSEARPLVDVNFSVQYISSVATGVETHKNPSAWVEKKFPKRLEPYFLFDGERLDSFFKEENRQRVENAILEIAKVDRMANMQKRLDTIGDEIRREAARKSKDSGLAEAQRKKEAAEHVFNNAELELSNHRDTHEKLEAEYLETEATMKRMAEHFSDVKVITEHKEKIALVSEKKAELSRWATKNLPLLIMESSIRGLLQTVEQRQNEGTLPPDFRSSAIEKMLDEDKCVCGRNVKDSGEASRTLNRILQEIRTLEGSGQELSDLRPYLQKFAEDLSLAQGVFWSSRSEIAEIRQNIIQLEDKLPKMASASQETGESTVNRYQRLQDGHQQSKARLVRLETVRNQKLVEFENAKKQFDKALNLDKASREAAVQSDFIERSIESVGKILGEWKAEVRSTVASALKQEFQKMLPKEDFVDSVEITDDFDVQVKIGSGNDIKDDLSAGERQTLAFAFSFGLNSVSGYELPMLIDTPFGRMGSEMKENVSQALARNTQRESDSGENQQVIILMTDSEYTSEVQAAFYERDPAIFKLANFGLTTNVEAIT